MTLRFTLLTDGSSDRVLLRILDWLLAQHEIPSRSGEWADLGRLPRPPAGLRERIAAALEWYPCDLLFVHRDAEGPTTADRLAEIQGALARLAPFPTVCVVPVRMQEAWLLFDESAIRRAAGAPAGRTPLDLPRLGDVERLLDPKQTLHDALRAASGLCGRRAKKFQPTTAVHRLAEIIVDYQPLRQLPAFRDLEAQLTSLLPTVRRQATAPSPSVMGRAVGAPPSRR